MSANSNYLPTQYQQFIFLSRYSKWLHDEKRRETWPETVKRYFDFFEDHLKENNNFKIKNRKELEDAMLGLEIMPSMRCLMTAGEALKRENVAGYNCSYISVNRPQAFDEILYVLMNGTGVGFSVESNEVEELPKISESFHESDTTIVVADSKLGWAKSLKELIGMLYMGQIPKFDVSKVRPAGSPLKTFGGRASGPEPLVDLFKFTIETFKRAAGRKLTSLEAHDIVCKIAEIVVVGGVRRSALISLSDLNDDRMRHAKSGQWWVDNVQRALANNSAVYKEKPDMAIFMEEWKALYDSKSGERGIFNRNSAQKHIASHGRREHDHNFGVNPCLTEDTWINTKNGLKQIKELIGVPFTALVNGNEYDCPNGFFFSGIKDVYEIETFRGHTIKATDNHKFQILRNGNAVWEELKNIQEDDVMVISDNMKYDFNINKNDFDKGWIIGEVVGDGGHNPSKYHGYVRFWGKHAKEMAEKAFSIIDTFPQNYHSPVKHKGPVYNKTHNTWSVFSKKLTDVCSLYLTEKHKELKPELLRESDGFLAGFIRGIFDADGSIQGIENGKNSPSLRLSQSNKNTLKNIQIILNRFGIFSTIRLAKEENNKTWPDGNTYKSKTNYELMISKDSILRFNDLIGFYDIEKSSKMNNLLNSRKRGFYKTSFLSEINSIKKLDKQSVFDCTIDDENHMFEANGFISHNCGEILLRDKEFCNLSEVIVRASDTEADIERKIYLATILGTFQSTLTNFKYLSRKWKENCEEERLLGVSLTGIMDNPLTNGKKPGLEDRLNKWRNIAIETNKNLAKSIGIPQSKAVTCIKPSGTVSQLTDSASGIHSRHSPYYIRTVRGDKKDPLSKMMVDKGFPVEDDVTKPYSTYVFSFPQKAPSNAVFRTEQTAVEQLELWLKYKKHWTEHNPSVTVSVKEHEWMEVGAWVYKNFDDMTGVSFLPYSDMVYKQQPYQECTKEEYSDLLNRMPKNIDWSDLVNYENIDTTIASQELSCTGPSGCEI